MLTPESFELLRALNDQYPCSGEMLAEQFGVSRHRITALIKEIEQSGIPVEHVPRKGYRLQQTIVPISLSLWEKACLALGATAVEKPENAKSRTVALRIPSSERHAFDVHELTLEHVDCVDSTSSTLIRRLPSAAIHGHALVAEWQSSGRGRQGRPWFGIPGGSLMFSLGWHFEHNRAFLSGLPLAMSLAIARALEKEGFSGIQLKWPNDLVHHFRKLGGILVELSGDAQGPTQAVIGVGINITFPKQARADISQAVADLSGVNDQPPDRNLLLTRILLEMIEALALYAQQGFAAFSEEWQMRHAYQHRAVRLSLPDRQSEICGTVAGVDDDGALLLNEERGNEMSRYTVGEISLRRL